MKLYSFSSFTLSSSSKKKEEKNLSPRNRYSGYDHLSPVEAGEINVRKYILKALYLFEKKIKLLMLAWLAVTTAEICMDTKHWLG